MEATSACGFAATKPENTVSPEEFAIKIKSPEIYLVDVRKPEEFADGHIEGAANLDVTSETFESDAEKSLPKDKTIAVYCGTGRRSAMAAEKLLKLGFKILNLDGGLNAWTKAGLPVVK